MPIDTKSSATAAPAAAATTAGATTTQAAPWAGEDSYESFVRQSIADMDRDLRFFDAHVLEIIDKRFFGDCHDVFQHFRSAIHERFGAEESTADLQFDLKRAWLAGQLQRCEQPKRQKDASDMLEFIQRHKAARALLEQHKAALANADSKDFEATKDALLNVLGDLRGLNDEIMRANAQFPGTVAEADLQHLERWEAQRDSLEQRAKNRGHSVAVVGLEKTGKSTVCNALMGTRLLPAAVERCTMLTTRIRPSNDDEYRVEISFTDGPSFENALVRAAAIHDAKQRELLESRAAMDPDFDAAAAENRRVPFDAAAVRLKCQHLVGRDPETIAGRAEIIEALQRYTANIDNMLAVQTVTVWTPELSADNMEVVDVPGFDSPLAEHREAAARSLNEADAFLFVTNGAANVDLTAPALELVRTIRKLAPQALEKGYAVVTHLDSCSSRAEFQNRRAKAVGRLVELGFLESRIFCACPPLSLLESERAAGAPAGENLEHYEEMSRKARVYGVQLGFEQMRRSLEEFVRTDLPRRRRGEALTLSRLAERACSAAAERVVDRLKSFLPADQVSKLNLIEGKLSDETVDEIMSSIETSIARTHNAQWTHLWTEIWAHVNSSAADWLAANYFDRFDALSAEWTRLFHEHYDSEKSKHSRDLYDKFKSRLSVLPIVLEEPDPCDAEMAHRVWLVDTVHRTLTAAASRVARSIYEVLEQYHHQLSRTCFARFTDDMGALQAGSAPIAVTEMAVRLKVEFNTLQAARLLEKRVLRYPSWHPRRVLREARNPIPGLYSMRAGEASSQSSELSIGAQDEAGAAGAGSRTTLTMGAAGTPQGFPKARQPNYRAAEEENAVQAMLGHPTNAEEEQRLATDGIAAKKMPHRHFGRRGSVHDTKVRVAEVNGEHFVTYQSSKKKGEQTMLPLSGLEIRQGLKSSKSFEALDAKARDQFDGRALSLRSGNKTLDLVLGDDDEVRRVVRVLQDLKAQDERAQHERGEGASGDSDSEAGDKRRGKKAKKGAAKAPAPAANGGTAAAATAEAEHKDSDAEDGEDDSASSVASEAPARAENAGGAENRPDTNDVRALEKGLKVSKMPHSRRGSIHGTKLKVADYNGEKCVVYESRNKWTGDIVIPIKDCELREGPVTDAFDKLGAKKGAVAGRALALKGSNNHTIDVVFKTEDEYERAVRGLRALHVKEAASANGTTTVV